MLLGGPGPSELALAGLLVAPWDMFFAIPKICQKIDPSNTHLLGSIFASSTKITQKNVEMGIILGPSVTHFLRFFDGCSFSLNFSHFSMKNIKIEKMKKCLPIRKLRCFMRVARLKKMREALKNHDEKNIDFSWKFDPISRQKNESNQICYTNHSKHVNQGTLSVYGLIFGPFRDPKGIPKLLKMDEGLW